MLSLGRVLLRAVPLLVLAAPATAQVEVELRVPREDGYFVGDTLTSTATLRAGDGLRLQEASLPTPGPLAYWLDLRAVAIEHDRAAGADSYRIQLTYQTFYTPLDTRRLQIPGFTLRLEGGDGAVVTAAVPGWSFVSSPLRELQPPGRSAEELLAPDALPRAPSLRAGWLRLAGLALALVLALGLLAWHLGIGPFRARPARPFTRAAHAIGRLLRQPAADPKAASVALHRAFDAAFGQPLLLADLDLLAQRRPDLAPLREEIGRFFAQSREAFFGLGPAPAGPAVLDLARRLSARERQRP